MLKNFLQKFVVALIALVLVINPYIDLIPTDYFQSKAKAAESTIPDPELAQIAASDGDYEDVADSEYIPQFAQSQIPDPVKNAFSMVVSTNSETFSDLTDTSTILGDLGDAKIILTQTDLDAIKALRCMKNLLPPFAENMKKLFEFTIPRAVINSNDKYKGYPPQEDIVNAVFEEMKQSTPRFSTEEEYLSYLKYGIYTDSQSVTTLNKEKFNDYVNSAKAYYGDERLKEDWIDQIDSLADQTTLDTDINTLACVTRITDADQLMALIRESKTDPTKKEYLQERINESLDGLKIDIRAVKALIYLVTPKNLGGAGHWRLRVKKFLQTGRKSGESDALIMGTPKTVSCDPALSAAECGMAQYQPGEATIEDQDGSAYTAYLETMNDGENNDSVHQQGQAIDISEIDDIRCTTVKEKKSWGNVRRTYTPDTIKPVKLAWQTTEGFNKSQGSNDFDMMSLIKSMATSDVIDFLGSVNGTDMTDYEGDLTRASFNDLVDIVGKSLMTEILASPDHNLKGFSSDNTLRNLGGMYIADYLGIDRKLFTDKHINTPADLFYEIGRGAIETRMKLPLSSLDTPNPTLPLYSTLVQVGTRKLEYELGLANGDLARLDPESASSIYIGARVIEDTINFKKFSWPEQDTPYSKFASTADNLNWFDVLQLSPETIDTKLHLKSGVTKALVKGKRMTAAEYDKLLQQPEGTTVIPMTMTSDLYASIVGQVRLNETTFGFQYFASNDAAYSLPSGLWGELIKFDPNTFSQSLSEVGIYTLSRLLGEDDAAPLPKLEDGDKVQSIEVYEYGQKVTYEPNDGNFGRYIFRSWIRDNLTKYGKEACQAPIRPIDFDVSFDKDGNALASDPESILKVEAQFGTNLFKPVETTLSYQVTYTHTDPGVDGGPKTITKDIAEIRAISEEKASKYGFFTRDMQRILGCSSSNGRQVYERIGSELLYTALINQALSESERAKIDMADTDPTIHVANKEINFYIQRIFYAKKLIGLIDSQYGSIVTEGKDDIKSLMDQSLGSYNTIKGVYGDLTKLEIFSISRIAATASQVMNDVDTMKKQVEDWKEYMRERRADLLNDVKAVNQLVYYVNELWTTIAEMERGKAINGVERIKFQQIDSTPLQEVVNQDRRQQAKEQSDKSKKKGLSAWQVAQMMFDWIAGTITSSELFYRLGANSVEANVGLPPNSLVYLVRNYQQNGVVGLDAFYQSVGQARIEENFGMPAFYFQGTFTATAKPNFQGDLRAVYTMIANDPILKGDYSDLSAMTEAEFLAYMDGLRSPVAVNYAADPWIQLVRTPGSPYSISSEPKTPGEDLNKYKAFYKKIADSEKEYKKNLARWQSIVDHVDKRWQAKRASDVKGFGSSPYTENTIKDIVANIKQRCFTGVNKTLADGTVKCQNMTRSPENDLLFRMGLPQGNFAAMTAANAANNAGLWARLATTSKTIEKEFTLDQNAIKALFTGEDTRYVNLSRKEKKVVEGSALKINSNVLSFYAQMLNHEVLPNDMDQYNLDTWTQYYVSNPYAPKKTAAETCPILYEPSGDDGGAFSVNNETIENNTYCYYDMKGRHCFKSWDEAQRYAIEHEPDSIKHAKFKVDGVETEIDNFLLGYLAYQITVVYNQAITDSAAIDGVPVNESSLLNVSDIYFGLRDFVNDYKKVDIFDSSSVPGNAQHAEKSAAMISVIANTTTVSASILEKLFTREPSAGSVSTFKKKVGVKEAQKLITYKLFNQFQLGFAVGPDYFDAGDLYDVLNGDYTSLTNIATNYIDMQAELKPGTTRILYEARDLNSVKCALSQAGGSMLGRVFGLNNVPLDGINNIPSFRKAIGQAKVEETLSLPRGTFRGGDLSQLLDNIGPLNFMVAFKIPMDPVIANGLSGDINTVLGSKTGYTDGASLAYRLTRVRDVASTRNVLTGNVGDAVKKIDATLKTYFLDTLLPVFRESATDIQIEKLSDLNKSNKDWYFAVQAFIQHVKTLDDTFGVIHWSTYELLTKNISPDQYISRIGGNLAVTAAIANAASMLGVSDEKIEAAAGVLSMLKNNLVCVKSRAITPYYDPATRRTVYPTAELAKKPENVRIQAETGQYPTGVYDSVGKLVGVCEDDGTYGDFGKFYSNLNTLFTFNLDDKMSLPEGTIAKVLSDPEHIVDSILNIGLGKLDQQMGLDPSKPGSFSLSGFWRATFYKDSKEKDAARDAVDKKCYNESFPGGADVAGKMQYDTANKDVNKLKNQWPAKGIKQNANEGYESYANRVFGIVTATVEHTQEMAQAWLASWRDANTRLNTASSGINSSTAAFTNCKIKNRTKETNATLRKNIEEYGVTQLINLARNALGDIRVTIPDCNKNKSSYTTGTGSYPGYAHGSCEVQVGIQVPDADLRALITGDLRYISPIAMAVSSNIAMIPIDRMATDNCNENADGKCETAVPPEFRLSYNDYRYAVFGSVESDNAARDVAAYVQFNGVEKNPDGMLVNSGQDYPVVDTIDAGLGYLSDVNLAKTATTTPVANNKADLAAPYGYRPGTTPAFEAVAARETLKTDIAAFEAKCQVINGHIYNTDPECAGKTDKYGDYDQADYISDTASMSALKDRENTIIGESKKLYQDNLTYKTLDIAAWKLDGNAFPGFARAIATGNAKLKLMALTTYLKNGAERGHLFGMDFDAVKNLEQWAGTARFLFEAGYNATHQGENKFDPLSTLASNSNARYFATNFITSHSKAWFGFEIQPEMAEGILTGIGTIGRKDILPDGTTKTWTFGNWGIQDVGAEQVFADEANKGVTVAGKDGKPTTMQTLGGATQDYLVGRLFNWADDKLGLEAGTSFKLAQAGYKTYKAYKTLADNISYAKELGLIVPKLPQTAAGYQAMGESVSNQVASLQFELTDAMVGAKVDLGTYDQWLDKNNLVASPENLTAYNGEIQTNVDGRISEATNGKFTTQADLEKTTVPGGKVSSDIQKSAKTFQAAKDLLGGLIIGILVSKLMGKMVSGWERDLGMLPGTLMPLVSSIVTAAIIFVWNAAMSAIGWNCLLLTQTAWCPWLAIGIAVFGLIYALFNSTKYFYWCTGDGYYPSIGSLDYNKDVAGFGWIGGRIDKGAGFIGPLMSQYGVKLAQYKARRLIGDMLDLQNSSRFRDSYGEEIIPIQIMTGRKADVDFWKEGIDTNMCQKVLGPEYMSCDGMCGKATSDGGCVSASRMGIWANTQTTGWTHIGF